MTDETPTDETPKPIYIKPGTEAYKAIEAYRQAGGDKVLPWQNMQRLALKAASEIKQITEPPYSVMKELCDALDDALEAYPLEKKPKDTGYDAAAIVRIINGVTSENKEGTGLLEAALERQAPPRLQPPLLTATCGNCCRFTTVILRAMRRSGRVL